MVVPSPSRHPLFDAGVVIPLVTEGLQPTSFERRRGYYLLRVELDDELLGERHGNLSPLGHLVDEDALTLPDDLQPARDGTLARDLPRKLERQCVQGLLADVDDVVLRHPVARDVDLDAIDGEVSGADQLARHPPRASEARAVDDVVEPALQDAQQVLAGLAREAVGLLVVTTELLLHHAVGEASVLLLLQLSAVFAFLDPRAAVLARRVGTLLEGLISANQVDAEAARLAGCGSGVTSHFPISPLDPAPLGRTAAVVRLRRDVGNGANL